MPIPADDSYAKFLGHVGTSFSALLCSNGGGIWDDSDTESAKSAQDLRRLRAGGVVRMYINQGIELAAVLGVGVELPEVATVERLRGVRAMDPDLMPQDLRAAHRDLGAAVDRAYRKATFADDVQRVGMLFERLARRDRAGSDRPLVAARR